MVGFDAPYRTLAFVTADNQVVERATFANPENLDPAAADQLINKLLPMWTSDTQFVVDQLQKLNAADASGKFTGKLDLNHLGMFGHSFGGATALQFCHDDVRCKAALDVDGAPYGSVVHDGLKQPLMFLLSDHSRDMSDPANQHIGTDINSIYNNHSDSRWFIIVRGANHFSFSDQMLQKNPLLVRLVASASGLKLDARRGLAIATNVVHTFFDVSLKGTPSSQLANLATQYPEIQTQTGRR